MVKKSLTTPIIVTTLIFFSCVHCSAGTFIVTRVFEGDRLEAADPTGETTVRLAGIDAPEMPPVKGKPGQPFCEKARLHLSELVLGQTVMIQEYGQDRYGRKLGVVYLSGVNVNLEMITAGLAEVYRGQPPETFDLTPYRQAEYKARKSILGIWVLRDQYFSPKDWREVYEKDPIKN